MTCRHSILTALLLAVMPGCSWQTHDGNRRHLVLGLGVIDVQTNTTTCNTPTHARGTTHATATRWHARGVMLGDGPAFRGLGVGVIDQHTIEIQPYANLIIDWQHDSYPLTGHPNATDISTLRVWQEP